MKDIIESCRLCNDVSGVYQLECESTGLVYVGRSETVGIRVAGHIYSLRSGMHYNKRLQADFSEYGEAAFSFEVLEEVHPSELIATEHRMLMEIPRERLYNKHFASGNTGAVAGVISEETRRKQSERQQGDKNHFFGRKHSAETKERMRQARLGTKRK